MSNLSNADKALSASDQNKIKKYKQDWQAAYDRGDQAGMDAAHAFIERFVLCEVPTRQMHNVDYKTALQERVQQKKNQVISYRLVAESGPDHDKQFTVELSINGEVVGMGNGSSKKRAEQDAARVALENFN